MSLIGRTLGRYHILEALGEGGMASVYKAYDLRLKREVALKVIRKGAFPAEQIERMLLRFDREARSLAQLAHPNIVRVLDYGEEDGTPYLVMEYLPGGTLKERLKDGPLAWKEALQLLLPIARALAYAHSRHTLHRDVKPSNILLTEGGEPMLADFGIAKILDDSETHELTSTGVGIGTPDYMAPEQGLGFADERADIYAFGVVLYECITGRRPFTAETPMAVLLKKNTDPLPRPSQFVPNLPPSVEHILITALARDPAERYPDMQAFIQDIEAALALPSVPARMSFRFSQSFGVLGVLFIVSSILAASTWIGWKTLETSRLSAVTSVPLSPVPLSSPENTLATVKTSTPARSPLPALVETPVPATITPSPSNTSLPSATPTLKVFQIAFSAQSGGSKDIFVVNSDGSGLRAVTTGKHHERFPSWSPDGNEIVFQTGTDEGDQELAIVNLNSGKIRFLTNNDCDDFNPVWSPDGKWIAFHSLCNSPNPQKARNIFKIRPDGTQRTQLTYDNEFYNWFPAWSPDGRKITFSSNRSGSYYIYVMNADGSGLTRLQPGCVSAFSPDGSQIVYGTYCTDTDVLHVMNADGSNPHTLTPKGVECKNPSWSPDGTRLAFQVKMGNRFAIYVMELIRPDRSDWLELVAAGMNADSPVWRP